MTESKNGKKYRVGSFYSYILSIKKFSYVKKLFREKSNEVKTVAARIKR